MSNENRYSFPSCWNNLHFQVRGMSCWEWFEQDFEGYYTAVPIFAPIRLPSERLLPPGEEHLVGPNNDLVNLDYDVGAQVLFRSDLSAPSRRTKSVRLGPVMPLGNINVVAKIANSGIAIDQGNTSDSGLIRLLGMSNSSPDTIVASGRTYITAARRFSNQPTWVSVSAEVPDLDSVGQLRAALPFWCHRLCGDIVLR
ncbi:MAG: hypothetical protein IPH75_08990 [bacterium]|nr:hypothetical protein [bacterium]